MHHTVSPATFAFLAVVGLIMTFAFVYGAPTPQVTVAENSDAVAIDVGANYLSRRGEPTPTATPTPGPPPPPSSLLDKYRIVSFYGHPFSSVMGVLGEGSIDTIYDRLKQQAEAYATADPDRPVKLAFHFIYGVAQESPGVEGTYLYRTDDAVLRPYIDFARDHDMLIFLDLQNGRSDVASEVERVLPYLKEPHVHLALDPEFTMPPGEQPGVHIGHLDSGQINRAQEIVQGFTLENRLPNKILIVHQFQDDMVLDRENVQKFDRVDLVFDMDGWGWPDAKTTKYARFAASPPAEYSAIKLFYKWDSPLLAPATVLALDPKPSIVIYQ
jgi:hypothetical protein